MTRSATPGAYKVTATLPDKLIAGKPAELKIEVTSGWRKVPDVDVNLSIDGAEAPAKVTTGNDGAATAEITPTGAEVTLDARTEGLPAEAPTLYVPTKGAARVNAQRIVAPATVTPRAQVKAAVKAQPQLVTQISAQSTAPGAQITDTVKVTGLDGPRGDDPGRAVRAVPRARRRSRARTRRCGRARSRRRRTATMSPRR